MIPDKSDNRPPGIRYHYTESGEKMSSRCRGSLARKGDGLENHWRPAPREFKSPPRRGEIFVYISRRMFLNALNHPFFDWAWRKGIYVDEL